METIDRILSIVIDTQTDVKDLKEKVHKLEETQDKTYNKIDGFLVLINRHEAELAALRSLYQRIEERVKQLEEQRI